MAQSFVTSYKNHYRKLELQLTPSAKPKDLYDGSFSKEDIFFKPGETSMEEMDPADVDVWIRDLYLKRYWTTYEIFYCRDMIKKLKKNNKLFEAVMSKHSGMLEEKEESIGNELLEYCRKLYDPTSHSKVSEPLTGTRRIFGYIRPSRNYTPLTNYQFYMGKTAYNILKGDYKWGADRLALQVTGAPEKTITESPEKKTTNKNQKLKVCCCSCRS